MYNRYAAQLQNVKLFEGMTIEEIVKVLGCLKAYVREYKKGNYIYIDGDLFEDIGIILEGKVIVNREYQNGNVLNMNILDKNDTFGEDIICLSNRHAPYSLIANSDVEILYIKGKKLIEPESVNCKYRSHMNLNMLKRMAEYSVYVNKRMKYITILSLKKRVIMFLLDCQDESKSNKFSIGMNREEMSDYLNGTRSSISRILSELKNDNLIDYRKSIFSIKNKQELIKKLD